MGRMFNTWYGKVWKMEWKIFGMVWNGRFQVWNGIVWKIYITFHSMPCTQELFCNISLYGERAVSNHDRFIFQFRANFLLFTPARS